MNEEAIQSLVGSEMEQKDIIDNHRLNAMRALLDRDDIPLQKGDALPPCWHWAFCVDMVAQSQLGPDGHPRKGNFLPDLGLPRRMWAGSRIKFHTSLIIGNSITKTSKIVSITPKSGKTGKLVFVVVRHSWYASGTLAIEEEQDIVYRELSGTVSMKNNGSTISQRPTWTREIFPDSVKLFRYSAITFNSHRIHYDRPYCLNDEGYSGLVVHGPLIATLLIDLFQVNNPNSIIKEFSFRAVAPLFDGKTFKVNGLRENDDGWCDVWAENADGFLATHGRIFAH